LVFGLPPQRDVLAQVAEKIAADFQTVDAADKQKILCDNTARYTASSVNLQESQ
jgi:hypothetical protein